MGSLSPPSLFVSSPWRNVFLPLLGGLLVLFIALRPSLAPSSPRPQTPAPSSRPAQQPQPQIPLASSRPSQQPQPQDLASSRPASLPVDLLAPDDQPNQDLSSVPRFRAWLAYLSAKGPAPAAKDLPEEATLPEFFDHLFALLLSPQPALASRAHQAILHLGPKASPLLRRLLALLHRSHSPPPSPSSAPSWAFVPRSASRPSQPSSAPASPLPILAHKKAVLRALGFFQPPEKDTLRLLTTIFFATPPLLRTEAYQALYQLGPLVAPALPVLLQGFRSPRDPALFSYLFEILKRCPAASLRPVLPTLKPLLHDPDPNVTFGIAGLLLQIEPPAEPILALLRKAFQSSEPLDQTRALSLLSRLPSSALPPFLPFVTRALQADDEEHHALALQVSRKFPEETRSLRPLLRSRYVAFSKEHREEILEIFWNDGTPDFPELISLFVSSSPSFQSRIAETFASKEGSSAFFSRLFQLPTPLSPETRDTILAALQDSQDTLVEILPEILPLLALPKTPALKFLHTFAPNEKLTLRLHPSTFLRLSRLQKHPSPLIRQRAKVWVEAFLKGDPEPSLFSALLASPQISECLPASIRVLPKDGPIRALFFHRLSASPAPLLGLAYRTLQKSEEADLTEISFPLLLTWLASNVPSISKDALKEIRENRLSDAAKHAPRLFPLLLRLSRHPDPALAKDARDTLEAWKKEILSDQEISKDILFLPFLRFLYPSPVPASFSFPQRLSLLSKAELPEAIPSSRHLLLSLLPLGRTLVPRLLRLLSPPPPSKDGEDGEEQSGSVVEKADVVWALRLLGKQAHAAKPALRKILFDKDADEDLRLSSLRALVALSPTPHRELLPLAMRFLAKPDDDPDLQLELLKLLRSFNAPPHPPLVSLLQKRFSFDTSSPENTAILALFASFNPLPPSFFPLFQKALELEDSDLVPHAIEGLTRFARHRSLPLLAMFRAAAKSSSSDFRPLFSLASSLASPPPALFSVLAHAKEGKEGKEGKAGENEDETDEIRMTVIAFLGAFTNLSPLPLLQPLFPSLPPETSTEDKEISDIQRAAAISACLLRLPSKGEAGP